MGHARHQYLRLSHRQIRILKVGLNGNTDPPDLRCEFLCVSLDELPVTYKAVSYAWGDPTPVSQIICDDAGSLDLTASAADILNALVNTEASGYFWIDQLCINQEDREEKADQVRMMGKIFASATAVIAWLGASTKDSDIVADFVVTLGNAIKKLKEQKIPVTPQSLCQFAGCESLSPEWRALTEFLKHPWFERLWVVQEIVMASGEITLICGTTSIRWKTLAEVIAEVERNGLSILVDRTLGRVSLGAPDGLLNTACIYTMRHMRSTQQPIGLQFGLIYCLRFKATEPRDKVFAVMGLASDADDPILYPSYRAPVREVFTTSSRHMMMTSKSLRILSIAGIGWSRGLPDLPSWVPDWTTPHRVTIFGDMADNAAYRASATLLSNVRAGSALDSITLAAILVDAMQDCFPQPDTTFFGNLENADIKKRSRDLLDWISQLKEVTISSPYYVRNGSNDDVLWRTLIADTTRPGLLAGEECRQFFQSWLHVQNQWAAHGVRAHVGKSIVEQGWRFNAAFSDAMRQRVTFSTKKGLLGIGPPQIQAGDLVCIIIGAHTPFLLRKSASAQGQAHTYQLVGDCYVHGLMKGEGLSMGQEQDIVLI